MNPSPVVKRVGVFPWQPWPLSAWRWWSDPVRAERLAALRVGVALCLLLDLAFTYAPAVDQFFGPANMGVPDWFAWVRNSPRLSWSLLSGVGDPIVSQLALAVFAATSAWLLFDHLARCCSARPAEPARYSLLAWLGSGALFVAGVWSRELRDTESTGLLAVLPLALAGVALLWMMLHALAAWWRGHPWRGLFSRQTVFLATGLLAGAGIWLNHVERVELDPLVLRLLGPWHADPLLLRVAMGVWIASAALLLVGFGSRAAAFVAWALSLSFGHLNLYIDNAGDSVRFIILFYLMLFPCGASWSIDAWWRGRNRPPTIAMISPWALRLLFLQMILIYFCNGAYKLLGEAWWSGESLAYVLRDLALSRVSPSTLPLPLWAARWMTWSVLVWEVSFPLLVLSRWTRPLALLAGVSFHLGIFATMELGYFVPYMLCLYLPLLPWENWIGHKVGEAAKTQDAEQAPPDNNESPPPRP